MKKIKRYHGAVGDIVAIASIMDKDVVSLMSGKICDERAVHDMIGVHGTQLVSDKVFWFRREDGARMTASGAAYIARAVSEMRLIGPWKYGEASINGIEECRAALRAAEVRPAPAVATSPGAASEQHNALAACVPAICDIFGLVPAQLSKRLAASRKDPDDLAHNGLRKFAIGAIVHLGREMDLNAGVHPGGVAKQGLGAVAGVPELAGVHRGTLYLFHAQFAALCGLSTEDGATKTTEPRSEMGRFVRDRYNAIRRDARIGARE